MKKMFLLVVFAMAAVLSSHANNFNFVNPTGCTYTYHIVGVDPLNPTVMFTSSPITVPPGNTTFPTPSSIPGLAGLPGTVDFYFVRGWVNTTPTISANVGNYPAWGFPLNITMPSTPCHPQGNDVTWVPGSNGNIVVLIF